MDHVSDYSEERNVEWLYANHLLFKEVYVVVNLCQLLYRISSVYMIMINL
jgi:hypothetical protein